MKSAFFFSLDLPSREFIELSVGKAKDQRVGFLLQLDIKSGILSESKEVARSNYDAMVEVARECSGSAVLLLSQESGHIGVSHDEIALGRRIEEQGIGFGIVSCDGSRVKILNLPRYVAQNKLLNIDQLEDLIAPSGNLQKLFEGYEDRKAQRKMLRLVAEKYNKGGSTLVEAGTGVGKSLAYLIPAASWGALNGEVSVVSTSTINLQQQIVTKEIPLVAQLTGSKIKWALVKGRNNYFSIRRLKLARSQQNQLFNNDRSKQLDRIAGWAEKTRDGSLSDMDFVPHQDVWDEIKSDSDVCLGSGCPSFQTCHYQNSRRDISKANLLVVNHHLLLSDSWAKNSDTANTQRPVLPKYKRLVIDEAHNLEDVATTQFGTRIDTDGISRILERFSSKGSGLLVAISNSLEKNPENPELVKIKNSLDENFQSVLSSAKESIELLLTIIEEKIHPFVPGSSQTIAMDFPDVDINYLIVRASERLCSSLENLRKKTKSVRMVLEAETTSEPNEHILDLISSENSLEEIVSGVQLVFSGDHQEGSHVRWIEWSSNSKRSNRNLIIQSMPIEPGTTMRNALFSEMDTLILTSATLSTLGSFDFVKTRFGFGSDETDPGSRNLTLTEMMLASEFDFDTRSLLAIPTDFPDVRNSGVLHRERTAEVIAEMARHVNGGVLVLCTSWESLVEITQLLREIPNLKLPILVQGEDTRTRLLEKHMKNSKGVLMGVGSFWEGIDLPGAALRAVIIPRLPFSVPSTPINAARIDRYSSRGEDPFKEFMLPVATLKLKQGFGRLIRSSKDSGVVVILDKRIVSKSYGSQMRDSLPNAEVVSGRWETIRVRLKEFCGLFEPGQ